MAMLLHETVQQTLNELQQLLDECQNKPDDAAFLNKVRAKWTDIDHPCHSFVLACQTEWNRLGDETVNPTGTERVNDPTPKNLVQ